jgi:hypothetical protein
MRAHTVRHRVFESRTKAKDIEHSRVEAQHPTERRIARNRDELRRDKLRPAFAFILRCHSALARGKAEASAADSVPIE